MSEPIEKVYRRVVHRLRKQIKQLRRELQEAKVDASWDNAMIEYQKGRVRGLEVLVYSQIGPEALDRFDRECEQAVQGD